jgi:hypothetical protein
MDMQNNKRLGILIVLLFIAVLCTLHIIRNLNNISSDYEKYPKLTSSRYIDLIKFEEHNFTLLVPSTTSISDKFPNSSFIEPTWMQGATATGEPVASLSVYHFKLAKAYPSEWRVELRISITTDPFALENIEKKSIYTNQLPEIKLIHEVPFYVFPIQDAGMMKAISGYSYRTIYDGKAYVLEVLSYGSTYKDENYVDLLNDDQINKHIQTALEIIDSFTFINTKNTE